MNLILTVMNLLAINMDDVMMSLSIMWKGCLAIFVVVSIIAVATVLLNKFVKDKDNTKK